MLFAGIWSVWLLSEIALNRLMRSGSADKKGQDNNSIRVIWMTIGAAIISGVLSAMFLHVPIGPGSGIRYLGLLLIALGMVIRFYAVRSLGKMFTVDVTIREDHKLKRNGIYGIIRHPSYLGSLISFAGFGLTLDNWISLMIIVLPVSLAMLYRISIEEKSLIRRFGPEYREYMRETRRLIPGIY